MAAHKLATLAALLAALACLAPLTAAQTPIPITKVPLDMQVNITGYLLNGVSVPFNGPPCTGTCSTNPSMCIEFGTPCLQKVQNGEEGVTFSYDFNSTAGIAPVSVNAYICYSTWSQIGRPWRVTSGAKNILTDKSCMPAHATKKLPAATHTTTIIPSDEYPSATVYVRTVALCKNATSTSPLTATYPCARGRTAGYFQLQKIQTRTSGVKGAAAGVMVGGVAIVVGSIFLDKYLTHRRISKRSHH